MVAAAGEALLARGWGVAAAESCTAGLVLAALTERPGSSRYVVGGVVAYADRVKTEWLGVPADLLRAHGSVSEGVARAMAEGVARRFAVPVGLAVTGIAGPGGGVPGKPVGTVWYAVALPDRTEVRCHRFEGDRAAVRGAATRAVLGLLVEALGEGSAWPHDPDPGDRTPESQGG